MTSNLELIDRIVQKIIQSPTPVLMVDTCSALDIIRIGGSASGGGIEASITLTVSAVLKPRKLWLVTCDQVVAEWNDHANRIEGNVGAEIEKIDRRIDSFRSAVVGVMPYLKVPHSGLLNSGLQHELRKLSEQMMNASEVIQADPDCEFRAMQRVKAGLAPSSKEKQQAKDCSIIEHYLALAKKLRTSGFTAKIVFISSNTNDYGTATSLRSPLETDFPATGIEFTTHFAWAQSVLGL